MRLEDAMRFLLTIFSGLVLTAVMYGQAVVSEPPTITKTPGAAQPSEDRADIALDPASLLPDLPPLPPAKATLIGGSVDRIDRVQDQLTVRVFGGDKMKILFDTRTKIYRDGALVSAADLRQGDRVYIDTTLDGSAIFARNIHMKSGVRVGESEGVVVAYRRDRGDLMMRDRLSPHSLTVKVTPSTRIVRGERPLSGSQLVPGALISVKFGAEQGHEVAREVSVQALPGDVFTFVGQVTTLDLRTGLLVLTSDTDHKIYEVYVDPSRVSVDDNLRMGTEVTVSTSFDGERYTARSLTVHAPSRP